jgi:hypothetical protein
VIWKDLPLKRELFEKLKSGHHISMDESEMYRALSENEDTFRDFFGSIGFSLMRHSRNFFYFEGTGSGTFSARAAVFFFILVEWLSDQGSSVTESLFSQLTQVDKLPHLNRDRYRKYMLEAGIDSGDGLLTLLKRMDKLGFIHMEEERAFIFKTPAYRFLDLCNEIKEEETGENDD